MGFSIVIDADVIDEQFAGISPFNLKKDLKKNPDIDLMKLAEEIEAQIDLGEGRPAYCVLFIAPTDKNINCSKMRLQDKKTLKGEFKRLQSYFVG